MENKTYSITQEELDLIFLNLNQRRILEVKRTLRNLKQIMAEENKQEKKVEETKEEEKPKESSE